MRHVEIHFRVDDDNGFPSSLERKREEAVCEWRSFFHPYSSRHDARLPVLSDLTLSFTGMELGYEGFVVCARFDVLMQAD